MNASRQFWILKRFADVQISLWTTSDVKVSFRSSRPPWGMMDQRGTYPSVENFMQLCCVPFLLQMCRTGQNLWIFGRAIRVIQWGFTNAWSDKESLLRTTWFPVWKNLLQLTSRRWPETSWFSTQSTAASGWASACTLLCRAQEPPGLIAQNFTELRLERMRWDLTPGYLL